MTTPLSVLREAVKAVPALKYALGVGGLVAVVALAYSFGIDARIAFFGSVMVILLMTVLVVFARLSALPDRRFGIPALVLTWFSLVAFMAVTSALFSSVFFQFPVDLRHWLVSNGSSASSAVKLPADFACNLATYPREYIEKLFGPPTFVDRGENNGHLRYENFGYVLYFTFEPAEPFAVDAAGNTVLAYFVGLGVGNLDQVKQDVHCFVGRFGVTRLSNVFKEHLCSVDKLSPSYRHPCQGVVRFRCGGQVMADREVFFTGAQEASCGDFDDSFVSVPFDGQEFSAFMKNYEETEVEPEDYAKVFDTMVNYVQREIASTHWAVRYIRQGG